MRNIIIAALLAGVAATPALAQDGSSTVAGPLTGIRAAAIVGYERQQVQGGDTDGVVYGGTIGYDYQSGSVTAGVEAEATDSTAGDCVNDVVNDGDEICASFKRDLYAGFRIGVAVGQGGLVYVKAGYTNQRIGASVDLNDGDGRVSGSENLDGIRGGVGAEFAFGTNLFVRGEYRYSNYDQEFEKHQGIVGLGIRF